MEVYMKKGITLIMSLVLLFSISDSVFAAPSDTNAAASSSTTAEDQDNKALTENLYKQLREQRERIEKLEKQASSLNPKTFDTRLTKLEKKSESTISWNGDIRFRWTNWGKESRSRTQEAFKLRMSSQVNENTSFFGALYMMRHTDFAFGSGAYGDKSKDDCQVIGAALTTKNFLGKNTDLTVGRYWDSLSATGYWINGLGLDGAKITFGNQVKFKLAYANFDNITTGYGHYTAPTYGKFKDAVYASASYNFDKNITGQTYFLQNTNGPELMKAYGLGVVAKLNNNLTFKGDYIRNTASSVKTAVDGRDGYVARLLWRGANVATPNSWGLSFTAKRMDNAIGVGYHDYMPSSFATTLNIKNYELQADWSIAKNILFRAIQTFDSKDPVKGTAYKNGEWTRVEVNYFF